MEFCEYKNMRFERTGRVLTVTLNRPEKLNAIAGEFHREVSHVFVDVAVDPDSDVIVLTGAGTAFSAGGDLDYLEECRTQSSDVL